MQHDDCSLHARKAYYPLSVYVRLLAMEKSGLVSASIGQEIESLDGGIWSALVLQVAGELFREPDWIAMAQMRFDLLLDHQQDSGEFLSPDASVNPETRWYDELVTLHAAASYAVWVPGTAIETAVQRCAVFHLNETQPDHATAEPWGLLAFVRYAPPLADQVLHALAMQYPQGVSGIPLLLLKDVLYGLRRLIIESGTGDER